MSFYTNKDMRCRVLPIDTNKKDDECCSPTTNYMHGLLHSVANKMAIKTESGDFDYLNTSQKSIDMLTAVFKENKFAVKRKKLAGLLSLHGIAGLVIEPVEKNDKNTLWIEPVCIMNPVTYLDELVEVSVHSDRLYRIENNLSPVYSKYLYEDGRVVVLRYGMFNSEMIPASKFSKLPDREVLEVSKIPVVVFMNNEWGTSDLQHVMGSVETVHNLMDEIAPEWNASSTKFIMNKNFLGGTLSRPLKNLLTKFSKKRERVLELKSGDAKFGDAIQQLFTIGKLPELMTTIDWLENKIYDIANIPNDDPEEGKNNKHTEEVLQKQQSANESIISRLEIRQESYTDFVRLCLELLGSPDKKIEIEMKLSAYQQAQIDRGTGGQPDASQSNPV